MTQASKPQVVLTIAGFDPSNGAGVTADLQVFAAHGFFGTSAITALTVQSTLGVRDLQPVPGKLLTETLLELCSDLPPAGIKIGMLGSPEAALAVAKLLENLVPRPPVVLDPVLRSSSGAGLLDREGLDALRKELLPRVDWITPNWNELASLSGQEVQDEEAAFAAMDALGGRYPGLSMVATGGELEAPVDLLRPCGGARDRIVGSHVATNSTHGTGCAYSSALLCGLLRDLTPLESAQQAKRYVEGALRMAPGLGGGRGPMDLLWPMRSGSSHKLL